MTSADEFLKSLMVHAPGCPEPNVTMLCKCGQNLHCRNCGWGTGSEPCLCSRRNQLSEEGAPKK